MAFFPGKKPCLDPGTYEKKHEKLHPYMSHKKCHNRQSGRSVGLCYGDLESYDKRKDITSILHGTAIEKSGYKNLKKIPAEWNGQIQMVASCNLVKVRTS